MGHPIAKERAALIFTTPTTCPAAGRASFSTLSAKEEEFVARGESGTSPGAILKHARGDFPGYQRGSFLRQFYERTLVTVITLRYSQMERKEILWSSYISLAAA